MRKKDELGLGGVVWCPILSGRLTLTRVCTSLCHYEKSRVWCFPRQTEHCRKLKERPCSSLHYAAAANATTWVVLGATGNRKGQRESSLLSRLWKVVHCIVNRINASGGRPIGSVQRAEACGFHFSVKRVVTQLVLGRSSSSRQEGLKARRAGETGGS